MTLPLEGIRIVEMGQLIAIPHAIKLLGDMGAQIIRIESCGRPDGYRSSSFYENSAKGDYWNKAANFYEQNRNKLSLTLELDKPQGLDTLKELISISDVFAENFTPRVMKNFGLEYEDLRKIKPDIIMVSSTGYGYTGPWGSLGAIGYTTEAASGLAYMTGYEDGPPTIPEIPYADYTAAEHTIFAIVSALIFRLRTGRGQFIDISQTETLSSTIPEALLDYTVNGRIRERVGNRDFAFVPQGCFPCQGEDRWIAICVQTDSEWKALCEGIGRPELASDERFSSNASRWKHRVELDTLIADATRKNDQYALMHALQSKGVPAGAVLNGKQLLFDPHLQSRNFYEVTTHQPDTGMVPLPYTSRPWKMSETPALVGSCAPLLGEHNWFVLEGILAMPKADVQTMEDSGIIGSRPLNPRQPSTIPLADQKRLGTLHDFEADFREQLAEKYS